MVQIQSSCFPFADRNPQKFMDIFKAEESGLSKGYSRKFTIKNQQQVI